MKKAVFKKLKVGDIVTVSNSYRRFAKKKTFEIHQVGGSLRERDFQSAVSHQLVGNGVFVLCKVLRPHNVVSGAVHVQVNTLLSEPFTMWATASDLEHL